MVPPARLAPRVCVVYGDPDSAAHKTKMITDVFYGAVAPPAGEHRCSSVTWHSMTGDADDDVAAVFTSVTDLADHDLLHKLLAELESWSEFARVRKVVIDASERPEEWVLVSLVHTLLRRAYETDGVWEVHEPELGTVDEDTMPTPEDPRVCRDRDTYTQAACQDAVARYF